MGFRSGNGHSGRSPNGIRKALILDEQPLTCHYRVQKQVLSPGRSGGGCPGRMPGHDRILRLHPMGIRGGEDIERQIGL